MLTLFHGTTSGEFKKYVGICLCETIKVARSYASRGSGVGGTVWRVEVNDDVLSWDRLPEWTGQGDAPGDRNPESLAEELDVNSVWYTDRDYHDSTHDTLRLLDKSALSAIVLYSLEEDNDD